MKFNKIIKNEDLRYRFAGILGFIPDKWMVRFMYRFKTGRKLNLKDPRRYTDKIQKYKLEYRNPLMKIVTDKFLVRGFVEKKGYGEILNNIYGVYERPEQIEFESLPSQFVIKMTSGSGGNIIVKDKSTINIEQIKSKLNNWLYERPANIAGEWAYRKDSKIIIEKILPLDSEGRLTDYKIFCFNGKAEYLFVTTGNQYDQAGKQYAYYDLDFNKLPYYYKTEYPRLEQTIEKPENFDEMIKIAEKLSEDFPHVRVDFFNIHGKIIFGEMTFYHASGFINFIPDEFDYILGRKFHF